MGETLSYSYFAGFPQNINPQIINHGMISIHSQDINTYFILAITPLVQRIDTYSLKLEPKTHSTEIGLLLVISRLQGLRQLGEHAHYSPRQDYFQLQAFLFLTGGHFSVASIAEIFSHDCCWNSRVELSLKAS